MKKALILTGLYIAATVAGGIVGAATWPEPSRLSDLPGFLILAPLFQFVAAVCSLSGRAPGAAHTGAQSIPFLLLSACLVLVIVSAVWYWRRRTPLALLVFGLSVACLSLPGTNMVHAAIAA
jgi:hypothetical protein